MADSIILLRRDVVDMTNFFTTGVLLGSLSLNSSSRSCLEGILQVCVCGWRSSFGHMYIYVCVKGNVMGSGKECWDIKVSKAYTGSGILVCFTPALQSTVPFTFCFLSVCHGTSLTELQQFLYFSFKPHESTRSTSVFSKQFTDFSLSENFTILGVPLLHRELSNLTVLSALY